VQCGGYVNTTKSTEDIRDTKYNNMAGFMAYNQQTVICRKKDAPRAEAAALPRPPICASTVTFDAMPQTATRQTKVQALAPESPRVGGS